MQKLTKIIMKMATKGLMVRPQNLANPATLTIVKAIATSTRGLYNSDSSAEYHIQDIQYLIFKDV